MSSISGIGGNSTMMMQGMRPPRPSAEQTTQMAENLFSKLDSSGQGYLTKADLQSAVDGTSSATSSNSSSNVDDFFSQLDADNDGKVTKQEFTDTLKQIAEQLDSQAMQANGGMRGSSMGGGMSGMGGMPPPPPPNGDSGFTKDELTSQLSEIGSSDSKRADLITNIVDNFDEADSDGDGKVSFQEAMAYDQSSSAASSSTSSSSSSNDVSNQILQQIMKLMQAYNVGNNQSSTLLSTLSVSA